MSFKLNNGEIIQSPYGDEYALAKLLNEVTAEIEHPLSFDEARKHPKMPENVHLFAYHFGSFEEARKKAKRLVEKIDNPEKYEKDERPPALKRAKQSMNFQKRLIHQSVERSEERRRKQMEERSREL